LRQPYHFIRLFLLTVTFAVSCCTTIARNTESNRAVVDTITNRLLTQYLTDTVQLKDVQRYAAALQPNGNWSDLSFIDTVPTHSTAVAHLERLRCLALAYRKPGNSFYRQQVLYKKIMTGLAYYYSKKPVSVNWWFNQIGAPQEYMVILLLLKDTMPEADRLHYASLLRDETGNAGHKGKNRTWVSAITIHKGCLEEDSLLIDKGFASIASTIELATAQGEEGIKSDYSFHQHHEQLYSGGYGLSILGDISTYLLLARQTPFAKAFTPEKRTLLTNLMLQGHQLLGYRSSIDFGTTGRNISRPNSTVNISAAVLDKMTVIDSLHAADYRTWKTHLLGGQFPAKYRGNKHFWKSDMMTQHGADYYLSAKIISARTLGTEALNGENISGYYLPLGATNIATTGTEYSNLFPVWDWNKVPGTTAGANRDSTALNRYLYGNNTFGGGVSNGIAGAIAFEGDYKNIQAKKAYFFMGEAMVCLGAGITSNRPDAITTAINQCYLTGQVIVRNGHTATELKKDHPELTNPQWIYHNGIGYVFPAGGLVSCSQQLQSGSWKKINQGGSDVPLRYPVFTLWMNHGTAPIDASYAYIVMPEESVAVFAEKVAKQAFHIVRNDNAVQAIRNDALHLFAAVFYKADTLYFEEGHWLAVDKPGIIQIEQNKGQYRVSVADPLFSQSAIELSFNEKLQGAGATFFHEQTRIRIPFPSGGDTGKSVTNTYTATPHPK
jgi:chondroitin AC lyase